jgi:hypothetical protein
VLQRAKAGGSKSDGIVKELRHRALLRVDVASCTAGGAASAGNVKEVLRNWA